MKTFEEIKAKNFSHSDLVIQDENGCSDEGHAPFKIKIAQKIDCNVCYGDDPYGEDFCPVCQYCCGC